MAELALDARHFWMAQGPFLQALHRLHLTHRGGSPRVVVIVAIAWLPLCIGALSRVVVGQSPAPILFDISVHARILIAIPLMIVGERLFALRARDVIDQLYDGHFAERAILDRIIDRAERMRDSRVVLLAIGAVAMSGGVSVLMFGSAGVVSGIEEAGALSFARVWYALVAVPIVQVLLLRWLWQWAIWSYLLLRLSRVKLAVIATHPDHAAGIGFLGTPISAFAFLVGAAATTRAAGWATEILDGRTTLQACVPSFVVLLLAAVALACGPLLAFAPLLYRARHATVLQYNGLALRYVRKFHRKWIERRPDVTHDENVTKRPLLGTPDIQSLNDLIGSYEALVELHPVPFGLRALVAVWLATFVPMLPLVFTAMPIEEVFQRLGQMVIGFVA